MQYLSYSAAEAKAWTGWPKYGFLPFIFGSLSRYVLFVLLVLLVLKKAPCVPRQEQNLECAWSACEEWRAKASEGERRKGKEREEGEKEDEIAIWSRIAEKLHWHNDGCTIPLIRVRGSVGVSLV